MEKTLRNRIEAAIEQHGGYAIRQAAQSALDADRDALRALDLDDCYSLELKQIIEMTGRPQQYDPAAELREMFG